MENPDLKETMVIVGNARLIAEAYHLTDEVFASAFIFIKQNPEASVEEALDYGLNEWDL